VFLKMNSGMNRLGFAPNRYRAAWSRLNALPQVEEISHFTHFARADEDGGMAQQLAVFQAHTQDLPGERSLGNSAALLRCPETNSELPKPDAGVQLASDWMRPGVLLFGASPDFPAHTAQDWGLQPAMSLRSRVVGVQHLQAGDTVGYGARFTAPGPMRIGVVACGYADGYLRSSGSVSPTPVLVDGQRTQVVGRVSMDLITVDLSGLPHSGMGSEVTLWGASSQGHLLPIDEVAQSAGSIGYELMCALAARVPVEVLD
jgi:alanine racemase